MNRLFFALRRHPKVGDIIKFHRGNTLYKFTHYKTEVDLLLGKLYVHKYIIGKEIDPTTMTLRKKSTKQKIFIESCVGKIESTRSNNYTYNVLKIDDE